MRPVDVAVVGVGHLGKHHARLLQASPTARLVAVADSSPAARAAAVEAYGVEAVADYRELAGRVAAVSVVVPTTQHREVAGFFLEHDIDVLVEKPITSTVEEGEELVDLANRRGRILQVGHVERFNAGVAAIDQLELAPRYIESHRLAPLTFRGMDVSVVLDLMIHDIDMVLWLVKSPLRHVEAFGGAVFTPAEDMASAILKFENGSVAHLTASRVAMRPMRRMRLFSPSAYASVDFMEGVGTVVRKGPGWDLQRLDLQSIDPGKIEDLWKFVFDGLLTVQTYRLDEGNALRAELDSFLTAVQTRGAPVVSGEDGVAALAVAHRVLAAIAAHPW